MGERRLKVKGTFHLYLKINFGETIQKDTKGVL